MLTGNCENYTDSTSEQLKTDYLLTEEGKEFYQHGFQVW